MKVAERKVYRELKQDILNSMDINHSDSEKEEALNHEVSRMECDVTGAQLELTNHSVITFNLQYSYFAGYDCSTGVSSHGSKSVEIQLKEVTDREGNVIALKENQKYEIEKLLEEKVEI